MKRFVSLAMLMIALVLLPTMVQAQKKLIIFGIDDSRSYSLRGNGLTLVARIINTMKNGDILYLRRITETSYSDSCAVFRLEIPAEISQKPKNPFDRRARELYRKKLLAIRRLKLQAINILAHLESRRSRRTDLVGFLSACHDRFAAEDGQYRRIVIIASDMRSNVRRRVKIYLAGAEVFVVGFQSGRSPGRTQRRKAWWTHYLTKRCGAGSVRFIPPDVRFSLGR